jgi:hypothetical protein
LVFGLALSGVVALRTWRHRQAAGRSTVDSFVRE